MTDRLFIYGTLAPGRPNEHVLADVPGTWEPATVRGKLLDEGWGAEVGYPGIALAGNGDEVRGFLFSSTELATHWPCLDQFEGEGYERVLTFVKLERGSVVQAYIYALRGSPSADLGPLMPVDCGPCVVRHWAKDDQASLIEFANNRNVWRNMTHRFPHPYTEADATFWFGYLAEMPEPTHWAIEIDGRAVGGIGVDLGEGVYDKSGHFGYWLGEPFWGQGAMTATVGTISDKIMSRYGLCRLEAPVFEWNPASMRVLEKCGFVREGILKRSVYKDDQLIDTVLYARVR